MVQTEGYNPSKRTKDFLLIIRLQSRRQLDLLANSFESNHNRFATIPNPFRRVEIVTMPIAQLRALKKASEVLGQVR